MLADVVSLFACSWLLSRLVRVRARMMRRLTRLGERLVGRGGEDQLLVIATFTGCR